DVAVATRRAVVGDVGAVRRPGRVRVAVGVVGDVDGRPALRDVDHVDLLVPVAIRDERDPGGVRGPDRRVALAARDARVARPGDDANLRLPGPVRDVRDVRADRGTGRLRVPGLGDADARGRGLVQG